MAQLKLECSDAEYDGLFDAFNESRETTKEIKVNREALKHLLFDHATLHEKILGVKIGK